MRAACGRTCRLRGRSAQNMKQVFVQLPLQVADIPGPEQILITPQHETLLRRIGHLLQHRVGCLACPRRSAVGCQRTSLSKRPVNTLQMPSAGGVGPKIA